MKVDHEIVSIIVQRHVSILAVSIELPDVGQVAPKAQFSYVNAYGHS
jgi:hypothetical protein